MGKIKTITIVIEANGAAFVDEMADEYTDESVSMEVERILTEVRSGVASWGVAGRDLFDVNGNRCGSITVERES